ncbi:MAG: hypothetical protein LBR28_05205 [Bacteroidales bacterium]|jgi:hypothetical protein|nr:hypothetical protein [Bacteroidales bacterium]
MKRIIIFSILLFAFNMANAISIPDTLVTKEKDSIITETTDSIYYNYLGSKTQITTTIKWKIQPDGTKEKISEARSTITTPSINDTIVDIWKDLTEPPDKNSDDIIDNYKNFKDTFKNISKKDKHFEATWAGLEFAYKNWIIESPNEKKFNYELKGGWMFRWNFFDIEIPICSNMGFFIGLGYESSIFYLKNPVDFLVDITNDPTLSNFPVDIHYIEDAKLVNRYINLPAFFEIQSKNKKFSMNVGVIAGLNIYNRFKNEFDNKNSEMNSSVSLDNHFEVNRFKIDMSLRFAFHHFQIFAEYALISMFNTDFVKVKPFSIGLNVAF